MEGITNDQASELGAKIDNLTRATEEWCKAVHRADNANNHMARCQQAVSDYVLSLRGDKK